MRQTSKQLLLSSLLIAAPALAGTVSLEYSGFYDRLYVSQRGDFPLSELTFSVPEENGCRVRVGEIVTESKRYPLTMTAEQRLFIPFDAELKKAQALIRLEIDGDTSRCGLSLQVRERTPRQTYTGAELMALQDEMSRLQSSLQGFPMKYFAKRADGLRFVFGNYAATATINGNPVQTDEVYLISNEQMAGIEILSFAELPLVVSPWYRTTKSP